MFIAFEGPDNTGKSTSAARLSHDNEPIYNATKENYNSVMLDYMDEPDLIKCFDRIDWLSHMIYRLALPTYEWNDARVRTVFAMPETHLVFKVHSELLAGRIEDELYDSGTVARVNPVYRLYAHHMSTLNRSRGYELFRSVSIMEVMYDPIDGSFHQRLVSVDSPVIGAENLHTVNSDETLVEMLRYIEHRS